MGIIVKNVPVEAHHSIGLVERYDGPLCRIYSIITAELPEIKPELALQISFKALNDLAGPDGLVPTLLVFGAYPRMTNMDAPSSTINQPSIAMCKTKEEVRRSHVSRQINDALNTRNGPSTNLIHDLPLNSPLLVFRERNAGQSGSWKGPYKLLNIQGKSAIIELSSGPTQFRSTSVKPYYNPIIETDENFDKDTKDTSLETRDNPEYQEVSPIHLPPDIPPTLVSSTPLISSTATSTLPSTPSTPAKHGRGRPRKCPIQTNLLTSSDICFVMNNLHYDDVNVRLPPYTLSRQKEISGLLEKEVFQVVNSKDMPVGIRVFNSRFVDEIKNAGTDKAFEKSCLVVQAYNDFNKDLVLTQSPTIQQVCQRLIVCLAAILQDNITKLYLRDVTQAYVQSTLDLNRDFFIRPPPELITMMGTSPECILKVVKPLYDIPEAGNH